jgi:hypothetical protein
MPKKFIELASGRIKRTSARFNCEKRRDIDRADKSLYHRVRRRKENKAVRVQLDRELHGPHVYEVVGEFKGLVNMPNARRTPPEVGYAN